MLQARTGTGEQPDRGHVSTQLPYAITVAAISFVMFLVSGFVKSAWICLPIGIVLTVGTLIVIKKFFVDKKKVDAE